MSIGPGISLAATSRGWHIDAGWWIVMAICMLFMVAMMLGMVWRSRVGGGGWPRLWSGRWPGWREESPIDVLERRFAEGEISVEDYRERREALTSGARRDRGGDDSG